MRNKVIDLLDQTIEELDKETIDGILEIPPKDDMGDFAFPCFQLAKVFRKAPNMIATEIAEKIPASEDVSKVLSIFDNEQRIGHWNSYISSSLGVYDTSFKMIMKIKSKTGRNLSTLNDEGGGEILFMRNTDFQLIDIKNKNGIIYVKLEEV